MDFKLCPMGGMMTVYTSAPEATPMTIVEDPKEYIDLAGSPVPLDTDKPIPEGLPGTMVVAASAGGHYRFDAPFAEPCLYRISTPIDKEDPLTLRLLVSRLRKTFEDAQEMCFLPKGDYFLVGIRKCVWKEKDWPVWIGVTAVENLSVTNQPSHPMVRAPMPKEPKDAAASSSSSATTSSASTPVNQ